MFKEIIFIGGIHGVGKSTICQNICRELNLEYISASELLKWKEINVDSKKKNVKNILDTQTRLILGLSNVIQNGKQYLLDGHYCLLNSKNEIANVPFDTFVKINPISLNIILGEISEVKKRLETRDKKSYDYELLVRLQYEELTYAKHLSRAFGITLNIGTQNDYKDLLTSLRNFLTSINQK